MFHPIAWKPGEKKKLLLELAIIFLLGGIIFIVSGHHDILESFLTFSDQHENLELDEILIIFVYLTFTLLVFSIRRIMDLRLREEELRISNATIQNELEEKVILLREVNHRIKNNIVSIEALLNLQKRDIKNLECQLILNEVIGKVRGMRLVYDKLLYTQQYQEIQIKSYLEELIRAVLELFPDHQKVRLVTDIDEAKIEVSDVFSIGIIVNELITNCMKYGYVEDPFTITVSLKEKNRTMTLVVEDNGGGYAYDDNRDLKKGFGMTIIEALAKQLEGQLTIENTPGAKTTLVFNL